MYKTKFTSHKQYLCCLLLSRNVKRNIQTRVYYIFLVLSLKRNGSQTFKCSGSNASNTIRSFFKIAKYNLAIISFRTRKSASQVRKNIQMRDLILPVFWYVLFATFSTVMNTQESFHEWINFRSSISSKSRHENLFDIKW